MFKKLSISVITFIIAIMLLTTTGLQANNLYDSEALITYFERIGVLEEDLTPDTLVDWEMFEELMYALPDYEINEELIWEDELDYPQIIAQITKAIGQKEFIYTYDAELSQAEKFTTGAEVIGLDYYDDLEEKPQLDTVLEFLLRARIEKNYYNSYLGHVSDEEVFTLTRNNIENIDQDSFTDVAPELFELGVKGIDNIPGGAFTGYNIMNYNENPIFERGLKIRYSHNDINHALQMLSLLRREDFNARWDLKGRISSYVHHSDEWGDPDPESIIEDIDETRAVVGSESYDIIIEFTSEEEMTNFKDMIDNYALRTEEDTYGKIASPYYAPTYASSVELPEYEEVIGLRINHGQYYLQSYILVDYADKVIDEFNEYKEEVDGDFTIEYDTYYANPEFVDYLKDNLEN